MLAGATGLAAAQPPQAPVPPPGSHAYAVFFRGIPVGREDVAVVRSADGLTITASGRLNQPLDSVMRRGEVKYDVGGEPRSLVIEGAVRGFEARIASTIENGTATTDILQAGQSSQKIDKVSPRAILAPNGFFGAYAALADRLPGAAPGTEFRIYVVPQLEIGARVGEGSATKIQTPGGTITARRVQVVFANPGGDVPADFTIDETGTLLRLQIPAQGLDVVREDVSSPSSRTEQFSVPGDEPVKVLSNGATLAGTLTKPAQATSPTLPAIVLVPGSGPVDRDGFVAGIPVYGQMARAFVEAGYLVIRYDKRGVGQSGGRLESTTISDLADDVVAVVEFLKDRKDVDRKRIAVVGHSEGAWVALLAASRDKDIAALVMAAGPASSGADLVLWQQEQALAAMPNLSAQEKADRVAMQVRIHAALLENKGWEGVPAPVRKQADTPWFQSLLAFDPAKVMKNTRQPILILHGELDRQVPVAHADQLATLARERKKGGAVDVVKVPGVNHLLVAAKTGAVGEYATLPDKNVSPTATSAMALWLAKTLGGPKK